MPNLNARVVLVAHKNRKPFKYAFSLLLGGYRVLALDVNPGGSHFNVGTLVSINVTHWQVWPMEEAEPDERELSHRQWWAEFLARANIAYDGPYEPPPFVEPQLSLL